MSDHQASRLARMRVGLSRAFSCGHHLLLPFAKSKSASALDSTNSTSPPIPDEELCPELPAVLWTTTIYSYLDRSSQNALAQAHPEVAQMRRLMTLTTPMHMDWPSGSLTKFARPVKKVEFSPHDNQHLCVTYCKSKVVLVDKLKGPQHVLKGHAGLIADVKYSPTNNAILATAGKSDGTIRLWRRNSNKTEGGADNAVAAVSSNKNNSRKHGTSPYTCFRILQVHQHDLRHLQWSRSGTHLVSWGQDGCVRVSCSRTGTLLTRHWKTRFEVSHCHDTVACGPGHEIAYARNNERVHLWNWKQNTVSLLGDLHDEHGTYAGEYITSVAYSPDGTTLVVGCHVATIKVWKLMAVGVVNNNNNDAADNNANDNNNDNEEEDIEYDYVYTKQIHLGEGWSAVTLLTFTKDGRFLACSNHGSQIRIVDTTTDQIVATFKGGHSSRIESLCFSNDGRTLASGACDRTVRLWDTSSLCGSG